MTKVQISSTTLRFLLGCVAGVGLGLSLAACEQGVSPSEPTRDSGRFGDAYQLLANEHPDAPDEPPTIISDSLYVLVSYSGGCENHDFDLRTDTARDTTYLWLHHNDGGDDCEALIHDRLTFDLSNDALENPTILMLNPNNDAPFIVK